MKEQFSLNYTIKNDEHDIREYIENCFGRIRFIRESMTSRIKSFWKKENALVQNNRSEYFLLLILSIVFLLIIVVILSLIFNYKTFNISQDSALHRFCEDFNTISKMNTQRIKELLTNKMHQQDIENTKTYSFSANIPGITNFFLLIFLIVCSVSAVLLDSLHENAKNYFSLHRENNNEIRGKIVIDEQGIEEENDNGYKLRLPWKELLCCVVTEECSFIVFKNHSIILGSSEEETAVLFEAFNAFGKETLIKKRKNDKSDVYISQLLRKNA